MNMISLHNENFVQNNQQDLLQTNQQDLLQTKALCTKENFNMCISYLNQEIIAIGFPSLFNIYNEFECSKLINISFELLQKHKNSIEIRDCLENSKQRAVSDLENIKLERLKLKNRIELMEREAYYQKVKLSQMSNEIESQDLIIKSLKAQMNLLKKSHLEKDDPLEKKLKIYEVEIQRLKDKVISLLSNKNNRKTSEGKNCKMKEKTQTPEVVSKDEIKTYEDQYRLLISENLLLRSHLKQTYNELKLINKIFSSCTSEELDETKTKDNLSVSKSLPDEIFQLSYIINSEIIIQTINYHLKKIKNKFGSMNFSHSNKEFARIKKSDNLENVEKVTQIKELENTGFDPKYTSIKKPLDMEFFLPLKDTLYQSKSFDKNFVNPNNIRKRLIPNSRIQHSTNLKSNLQKPSVNFLFKNQNHKNGIKYTSSKIRLKQVFKCSSPIESQVLLESNDMVENIEDNSLLELRKKLNNTFKKDKNLSIFGNENKDDSFKKELNNIGYKNNECNEKTGSESLPHNYENKERKILNYSKNNKSKKNKNDLKTKLEIEIVQEKNKNYTMSKTDTVLDESLNLNVHCKNSINNDSLNRLPSELNSIYLLACANYDEISFSNNPIKKNLIRSSSYTILKENAKNEIDDKIANYV